MIIVALVLLDQKSVNARHHALCNVSIFLFFLFGIKLSAIEKMPFANLSDATIIPPTNKAKMIAQAMSDFNGYPIAGRSIYTTLSFDF